MERWLFAFFVGAVFSLFLPVIPSTYYVIIFIALAMLFVGWKPYKSLSGFFFACAWMMYSAFDFNNALNQPPIFGPTFFDKPHTIVGKIDSLVSHENQTQRFNMLVEQIDGTKLKKKVKFRLNWKASNLELLQGQVWQLKVKIKPAHGFANKGGFSYQTWLKQKQLTATGYVKTSKENGLISNRVTIRQTLIKESQLILPNHELSGIILALGFGDRSKITKEMWTVLQATGTQHLIAISGLHIGLVATGSFGLCFLFFKLLPAQRISSHKRRQWLTKMNTRMYPVFLSVGVAVIYSYLAGFSLTTIRALIMLGLFWLARLCGLKVSIRLWVLITLFLVIITSPFSLFSVSFWLSFYAVATIFLVVWKIGTFSPTSHRAIRWAHALVLMQLGLTLLMLPIVAIYSQQLSFVSFMANIIAVPWMSFTCIPLALLSVLFLPLFTGIAEKLMQLNIYCFELLWHWLSYLSQQSWSQFYLSQSQVYLVCLGVGLAFLIWMFPLKKRMTLASGFIGMLLIIGQSVSKDKQVGWKLTVLDVGQGLSIAIERGDRAIVYDTGASYPSGFNLAESVLLPYLQYQGISELDYLIISHQDNDHAGGREFIKEKMPIRKIMQNNRFLADSQSCKVGDNFYWQGLKFEVLWPDELRRFPSSKGKKQSISTQSNISKNDTSCVVRISDDEYSVLLTGDISKKVERELIESGVLDRSDVLIAPHHGSKTSSSTAFIKAISPNLAIFSTGFMNRWKMPNKDVLARYRQLDVKTLNTADKGAISVEFLDSSKQIETYRENHWPFWFAN